MDMRDRTELQRAHDILVGIILREVPFPEVGLTMRDLNLMACVLCWVLKHEHNVQFEQHVKRITEALAGAGFIITRGDN